MIFYAGLIDTTLLVLEANSDPHICCVSDPISRFLKQRVASDEGHLEVMKWLHKLYSLDRSVLILCKFILAHRSRK